MAFYTNGVAKLLDGTWDFLTDSNIKWLLIGTGVVYTFNKDDDFVDAGGANDVVDAELNGVANYTRGFGGAGRKALASKTVTINDTNDRVELDAADPTWSTLGTGDTIDGMISVRETTNDAATPMLSHHDLTNTPTNGGDVTAQLDAAGFGNFNT